MATPKFCEVECIKNENDCSHPQIDLPLEIVIYIMEYLPVSDRIRAGQVCRSWYEASQDKKLHRKEVVVLQDDLSHPIECLLETTSTFINFLFKGIELNNKLSPFWEKFCPKMEYFGMFRCVVSEKMFVNILSQCYNLETLVISNCRELMMSGRVLESEADVLLLKRNLVNLKEISITYNPYMSDALFYRFASIAPNLSSIDLTGCQISFRMGLYKKFYPAAVVDESNLVLSETVFTFNVILRYIREHAHKIKVLKLGQTFIDNAALSQLANVPGLVLTAIHLELCDQLTNIGVTEFVTIQKSLTFLDLSDCSRLTDHALIAICNNLINLVSLSIQNCRAITDIGVNELTRLEKLKFLNLTQCAKVTGKGIISGLCHKINRRLEKLHLGALQMDEESVCKIAENLPALRDLNLSWCFSAVTDRSVQAICKHLLSLNILTLTSCNNISDAGITGMTVSESLADSAFETTLQEERNFLDQEYPDPLHKINLRTRAEREIVNDAKRKEAVFHKLAYNPTTEGMCLVRIQGLRKIDFSGCNRITDVGLRYAFRFSGLQHLDLSRCQQITHIGLSVLSENNPSLEILIMNDCFNITDAAIYPLVKGLKRLKHLDIQGCKHLTDASLDAMGEHCQSLQYLNLKNCVAMSVAAALKLEKKLVTLHTIHYVGLKKDESSSPDAGICFVPAPPPPPGKKKFSFFR